MFLPILLKAAPTARQPWCSSVHYLFVICHHFSLLRRTRSQAPVYSLGLFVSPENHLLSIWNCLQASFISHSLWYLSFAHMTLSVTFMFYMAPMHMCASINLYAFSPINLSVSADSTTNLKGESLDCLHHFASAETLVCPLQVLLVLTENKEAGGSKMPIHRVTSQKFCLEAGAASTGLNAGEGTETQTRERKGQEKGPSVFLGPSTSSPISPFPGRGSGDKGSNWHPKGLSAKAVSTMYSPWALEYDHYLLNYDQIIHSTTSKCLWDPYHVPGSIFSAEKTAVNRTIKNTSQGPES